MNWTAIACILGFLGVALGAFGAHGLQPILEEKGTLSTFQTAAQYHMYHSLALLGLGLWSGAHPDQAITLTGTSFLLGIVLFSGSLYALSVTGIKILGAITPIGGVFFLIAWGTFAWKILKS